MFLISNRYSAIKLLGLFIFFFVFAGCNDKDVQQPQSEGIPEYTRKMDLRNWSTTVSSLNVWGLKIISQDKKERMPAIGRVLKERGADFGLMQEAWTEDGRKDIYTNSHFKYEYYFPVALTVGSGIQILSMFPFERHSFREFNIGGRVQRVTEGDAWAGKGVGMSRVTVRGLPVSLYDTHTVARPDAETQATLEDKYTPERMMQLFEIFQHIVEQTDSDAFILAGDFNMRAIHAEYAFWNKLSSLDGIKREEKDPTFCTSCEDNVYHGDYFNGQIDYIFVSPRLAITDSFRDFDGRIQKSDGTLIPLSDHYGWHATIGAVTGTSGRNPELARQSAAESLAYLKYRLEDYLNWYDKDAPQTQSIIDKICVRCNIEDSIKDVKKYQDAMSSQNPATLPADLKRIRIRLDSYFQIFR